MREKGISPPPRPDLGINAARKSLPELFIGYLRDLDKWMQRLRDVTPKIQTYAATLNPGSVNANTTSEQTFTVTGLNVADLVIVNKPSHTAGVGIVNARVSAADTLAITFMNTTGGAIDPPNEEYTVVSIRR